MGALLWELLTRRRLFGEAEDERQLAALVYDADVPRIRSIDPTLSRDLEAIVTRATERRVADRIQSAAQLAEYLQQYLDGHPLSIRPPSVTELLGRWIREHKAAAAATAVTALTIMVALVLVTQAWYDEHAAERAEVAEGRGEMHAPPRRDRAAEAKARTLLRRKRARHWRSSEPRNRTSVSNSRLNAAVAGF